MNYGEYTTEELEMMTKRNLDKADMLLKQATKLRKGAELITNILIKRTKGNE